jgi:hypothetical protein
LNAIIGQLYRSAGLKSSKDVSKSLQPYRVQKDNEDLQKVIDFVQSTMDPLALGPDKNL